MAWLAEKLERPDQISWLLQIQYQPDGPWNDHTGNLFDLDEAVEFMNERQADNPKGRYQLVKVTVRHTLQELAL